MSAPAMSAPATPSPTQRDAAQAAPLRESLAPNVRQPPRQIPAGAGNDAAAAQAPAGQSPVANDVQAQLPVIVSPPRPQLQPSPPQQPTTQPPMAAPRTYGGPPAGGGPNQGTASPNIASPAIGGQTTASRIGSLKENGVVLRHLTNNVQGFRLTGEVGASEWPIYVTDTQIQRGLKFQVGFLSAISVMPEASYLTLMINDQAVGRTNINAARGVRTATFDIPDGLMRPGFNSVRIMAEHRHRVDCSLQATYELWTQIDPTQTGLVLSGPGAITSVAELAALPVDEQGAMPIRAIIAAKTSMANIDRVIRATQMLSLFGRFQQTVVDVGPIADGVHGINLAIGTVGELDGLLGTISIGQVTGPKVLVVPASGGKRTTLVFTGRTEDDVNDALRQLSVSSELRGTPQGIRAAQAFPGYRMFGGERVKLRDLGVVSQEFSGRLFRVGFNIVMPPDFYSADYAKVILDLAGGYAPGLGYGAQVVVSVNTRNVVSLSLPKTSGDVFKQNPIPLPLGSLRPGLNRIEIEAQLAMPSDIACDPISAISGRNRFLLLDNTEIELPKIARIAHMPDLAVTATGGFPYASSQARPPLYVPAPSKEAIGAAATMATHFAISAGRPIAFQLTLSEPPADSGPALIVAPAQAVPSDTFRSVGLQQQTVLDNWSQTLSSEITPGSETMSRTEALARHRLVLQRNFPAACHMPTPQGGFRYAEHTSKYRNDPLSVGAIGDPDQSRLFEEWDANIRSQGGILARLRTRYDRAVTWATDIYADLHNWVSARLETQIRRPILTRQASLIVAQDLVNGSPDSLRTLVTAPNAAVLAQSVSCLVDPRVWQQIAGRVSVLNAAEGAIVNIPVETSYLIATQPLSINNLRLIAAGWLSLNPNIYVFMVLILALLLAAATNWFLKGVGRSTE
ncbi:cellulose biosynthesis cyclic di-GMP-binding regulatory protein BcsB [Roseiarcaceae bacterium H3SJ34-1]|uniref:cellulose biosynthesis cyclic di-GMP-binding regulatory protein BcsB n=1 Tax=Terripilifer ovatus TaxID=3032367 RepID=UPI003AB96C76|nr:cellulose biosynthesis cyclic di-GMP-binding regulatory protein BcsB [Roseiarcaceae bacterium H3SJ34-1]